MFGGRCTGHPSKTSAASSESRCIDRHVRMAFGRAFPGQHRDLSGSGGFRPPAPGLCSCSLHGAVYVCRRCSLCLSAEGAVYVCRRSSTLIVVCSLWSAEGHRGCVGAVYVCRRSSTLIVKLRREQGVGAKSITPSDAQSDDAQSPRVPTSFINTQCLKSRSVATLPLGANTPPPNNSNELWDQNQTTPHLQIHNQRPYYCQHPPPRTTVTKSPGTNLPSSSTRTYRPPPHDPQTPPRTFS